MAMCNSVFVCVCMCVLCVCVCVCKSVSQLTNTNQLPFQRTVGSLEIIIFLNFERGIVAVPKRI